MRKNFAGLCGLFAVVFCMGACVSGQTVADEAPDGPIRIGVLVASTGPVAFAGQPQKNTAELLAKRLNADGGINGRKIELLVRDTGGDSDAATKAAKELIDLGVVGILGPTTSQETMAIRQLCQSSKTPLLSCGSNKGIVSPVLSYVFKTAADHTIGYDKLCEELKRRGIKRIGLTAAEGVDEGLVASFGKYGIAVAFQEYYKADGTDFSAFFRNLRTDSIQALFIWSYGINQTIAIRDARKAGISLPIVVTEAFGDLYHLHATGLSGEGVLFPAIMLSAGGALPDDDPRKSPILAFIEDYRTRVGTEPTPHAAHMHDAFMLLTNAIKEAGTDRTAVRKSLEQPRSFFGAGGEFRLSPRDHCGLGADSIEMLEVRNGVFVLTRDTGMPAGGKTVPFKYLPTAAVLDLTLENVDSGSGRIFVDLLTGALAGTGRYQVLDTVKRDQFLSELEWSLNAAAGQEEQLQTGKLLAARYLVTGSVGKVGAKYYLNLKLAETESSRIISAYQASYSSMEEMLDSRYACIRALVR